MKNRSEVEMNKNGLTEEEKESIFSDETDEEGIAGTIEDGETYYDRIRREKAEETRQTRKFGKKEMILVIVLIVAVAVAVILTVSFTEEGSWQKTSADGHQYYRGASSEIYSGTSLKQDEDGKVVIRDSTGNGLISLPVYYDDTDALMLMEDNVYYDPRSEEKFCAPAFTEFDIDQNGTIWASREGKKKSVDQGFLYNGGTRYVFLEPVILEMNGYTVPLSALSYVETTNEGKVNIFYHDTKEMETIDCGYDVIAYPEGKIYTLELFSRAIIMPDGYRALLFFEPVLLENLL